MALLLDRGAVRSAAQRHSTTRPKPIAGKPSTWLLDHAADPNVRGRSGETPLAAAAYNGAAETVDRLLKHGADPDAVDDDGKGAMVYAAGRAYAPIVGALIDAGVDVNRRYAHGLTALMWAAGHDASTGVEDVDATLRLLVDRAARRDAKDDRGETAADIARKLGREREAKMLEP